MATTNLISKSLGGVLTESGNGIPNHISPKGSTYVDQDSGIKYINTNGVSQWRSINNVVYAKNTLTGNTSEINGVSTGLWYPLETNFATGTIPWSASTTYGITYTATTNQFIIDYGGQYGIGMNATFDRVSLNDTRFRMGVAIDSIIQTNRDTALCSINSSETKATTSLYNVYNLSGNTTVEMVVSNTTSTTNILVSEANITITRIGDYLNL